MKKRWMIVSGLVALCAALVLALVFLRPEQKTEVPVAERVSVSTTISLDFAEQTNGVWEFYEELDSRESPAWPDQIYTDGYVINDELPKLVPAGGSTTLSAGWSEDRTVYVSTDGSIEFSVTGLTPGTYRTALFVPQDDGGTGAYYSSVACRKADKRVQVVSAALSSVAGVYEDLALVIVGNGQWYAHRFNVQVQNVPESGKQNGSGQFSGLYYDLQHQGQITSVNSDGSAAANTVPLDQDYSEIFGQFDGQYRENSLQFNLYCGENMPQNEDATYVMLCDTQLSVGLTGMTPGMQYRCALIGETLEGEPFEITFSLGNKEAQTSRDTVSLDIFTRSGLYSDITLLAYGGDEQTSHSFTCEVLLSPEQEEEGTGIRGKIDNFRMIGEYPEEWSVPETGYTVNIPEGCVLSGYKKCALVIPISFAPEYSGRQTVQMSLKEESSGKVISSMELRCMVGEAPVTNATAVIREDFEPGAYILTTSFNGQITENRIFLEKEKSPMEMVEKTETSGMRGVTVYKNAATGIIPEIKDYLASMRGFDTDAFKQYLRFRYAPDQNMINSFALLSPNVPESEMTIDQEDLLFTVNWLIRDIYGFQLREIKHYSDATLIDLDALYAFFGDEWKELKALDYAAGMGTDTDGTVYLWLPVYFENEQGGLESDQLYLFVYILYQGPDSAYIETIDYFDPQLYNGYHTAQMLITDQTAVADLLTAVCRRSTALYWTRNAGVYPELTLDSKGDAVWLLQRRLQRLGYLTTSVDAVFSPPVQEAVAAWQADMGMEESTVVTAEMQSILHDTTVPRQLLMDWLRNHR